MNNVGGSAGDGGFQFQAKIIAFVSVHILAETAFVGLEQDMEGIPIAVSAETNGPGDDVRIELTQPASIIELQAKKGLRVDTRFYEAIDKIALGLVRDRTSNVILAVNPQTRSRIKEKLPQDLHRLRQGRTDAPHDQELLNRVLQLFTNHVTSQNLAYELVKRLFVHTFDVEEANSRDVQTALYILRSHVLLDEKQAPSAWDILVQAGHDLIEHRGRYEATDLVRLLQSRPISLSGSLLPVVKSQYQTWLSENTATFTIPGPSGLSLPINTTWTKLRVLSKQNKATRLDIDERLTQYQEWEKLASRADEDGYDAKDVAEIGYRVVIVGGPGMGKSTLCRKLAHELTSFDELVLRVHLPAIANRIQNGMNINAALIDAATDGFDAPFSVREALFTQTDCLVADGLDECGNSVVSVAEALQRWATAHPFIRIVITSRPIGYEIKYFPDWEHYDLVPLTKDQVKYSSWELINALASDSETIEKEAIRFQEQLRTNHIASLAARNPLLLGFLIQLSLEGESLAQQRASLYKQILDLWRVSLPQDRQWQISHLDALLAWRSLELIGWFFLSSEKDQAVRLQDQLVQHISQHLAQEMGIQLLQASTAANKCLQFWHERGVLDRFQIGRKEIYIFVHATFGEYAAGRYLASLSLPEIQQWVRNKYHDIRWQEPFLLASGSGAAEIIVETLLAIDAEDSQATSALVLAIGALAEAVDVPNTIVQSVTHRFMARLTSSEPNFVYEVAKQGISLVKRMPHLFTSSLPPLFQHRQEWTRLAAMYLALEAKEIIIDADEIETFLIDLFAEPVAFERGKVFTTEWDMEETVLILGIEALARTRPDHKTKEMIQTLYNDENAISLAAQSKLRRVLLNLGCSEFIEESDQREKERFGDIFNWRYQDDTGIKVLETILRLTSSRFTLVTKRRKLRALAVFIYALQVPKADVNDWHVLRRLDDVRAIEAVFSGYIQALKLDKEELAQDANWALAELERINQEGIESGLLLSLLPKFPFNQEIHKIDSLGTYVEDLIRALHHPSAIIVYGAARLLSVAGEGKEAVASLLFTSKDKRLLRVIAEIASELWGMEARPLLMKRLDQGYTQGSWWLIEELPHLSGDHTDQQFQQTLFNALNAKDPRIAISAVHALQKLDISLLKNMGSELQSSLLYWQEQGERAKAKSFYMADDCPTCRIEFGNAHAHISQLLNSVSHDYNS